MFKTSLIQSQSFVFLKKEMLLFFSVEIGKRWLYKSGVFIIIWLWMHTPVRKQTQNNHMVWLKHFTFWIYQKRALLPYCNFCVQMTFIPVSPCQISLPISGYGSTSLIWSHKPILLLLHFICITALLSLSLLLCAPLYVFEWLTMFVVHNRAHISKLLLLCLHVDWHVQQQPSQHWGRCFHFIYFLFLTLYSVV